MWRIAFVCLAVFGGNTIITRAHNFSTGCVTGCTRVAVLVSGTAVALAARVCLFVKILIKKTQNNYNSPTRFFCFVLIRTKHEVVQATVE